MQRKNGFKSDSHCVAILFVTTLFCKNTLTPMRRHFSPTEILHPPTFLLFSFFHDAKFDQPLPRLAPPLCIQMQKLKNERTATKLG